MDPARAERHRQFISDCTGGSVVEILGLLIIPCAITFLRVNYERYFLNSISQMT